MKGEGRTIFINGRFLTQTLTGVQRFAFELVAALDEMTLPPHWKVVLLVPRGGNRPTGFRRIEVRAGSRLSGHLWEQVELPFRSRGGVLVNLCNTAPLLKRRQIATIHDAAVFRYPQAFSFLFRAWYRVLLRTLAVSARRLLTVSEFSSRELQLLLGAREEKMAVLHEGKEHILRTPPDEQVLERWGLRDRPFVLAVSSLNPYKNFASVVAALGHLSDPGFELVIAGGSNPRVFQGAGSPLPAQVKYLGYVDDGELRALYGAAAAFVFPSLYEGFGLPPLEAMACGCPVVASRAASIPEVCGEAALYFDPENPRDIAEKVREMAADPSLQAEYRSRGLRRVAQFSWERCAGVLLGQLIAMENGTA